MEIVTKAVEQDKAANFEEAIRLYGLGVEHFLYAAKRKLTVIYSATHLYQLSLLFISS